MRQEINCLGSNISFLAHRMSRFAETLRVLVAKRELTQEQLATDSGVDRTIISRMLRGRVPTRSQLAALCAAISPESNERAELLAAHLRDEAADTLKRAGLDSRHLTLEVAKEWLVEERSNWLEALPISLQVELALISEEAMRTDEMRAMVADLAKVIECHAEEKRRLGGK
jgi:transcriptional regulator with XRE-family HTH domain